MQLRRELHEHNYKYYVLNQPTISDQDFDFLMKELQELEARHPELDDPNSPSQRVGSDLNQEFQQVKHKRPMLSLSNTYNEQDVREWFDSVTRGLGGEPFEVCCEMKYDGLSISLHYENGRLVQAVTRGDGVQGDDVTANVKTIRSIPLVLSPSSSSTYINKVSAEPQLFPVEEEQTGYPASFEIRGEILMPWKSFERLNAEREAAEEPLFANPRNAASGTLTARRRGAVRRSLREPHGSTLVGLPDCPEGGQLHPQGEDSRGDFRLHKLLGQGTQEPARSHRRHSAESELPAPAARLGLHSQESAMGNSI